MKNVIFKYIKALKSSPLLRISKPELLLRICYAVKKLFVHYEHVKGNFIGDFTIFFFYESRFSTPVIASSLN